METIQAPSLHQKMPGTPLGKPRHHHTALQILDALLTPQSDPAGDVGIVQELEVLPSAGENLQF